jgi:hypothetical protein
MTFYKIFKYRRYLTNTGDNETNNKTIFSKYLLIANIDLSSKNKIRFFVLYIFINNKEMAKRKSLIKK